MPTPPTTGHVILDGTPLIVEPGSYSKGPNALYGPAPLRLDSPINLSPLSTFKQDNFLGGMGAEHFKDTAMYYLGDADTRFGWAQCKTELTKAGTASLPVNTRKLWAIRPKNDGVAPALYYAAEDSGKLWRRPMGGNQIGNPILTYSFTSTTITALGRSFQGGMYGFHIGTKNGKIYSIASNSEALKTTPDLTLGNAVPITFLDSLGGRGDIAGAADGRLFKTTPTGYVSFGTVDMPVYDGEQWNQRMWVIGSDKVNRSALYVTDTVTTQEVFRWPAAFVAQKVILHSGQLYILGYTYDDEFDKQIGQLWSYNGSSMRLVFEVPDDIWKVNGFKTQYIAGADALKKWLAFGLAHKGVWFYDPEQDAVHPGPHLLGATENSGNYVSAVANFGGHLVAFNFNEDNFHFESSNKQYSPSYLMTSEYDAGFPGQLKTWVRARIRLKEPLPQGCTVQLQYTTQHIEQDITTSPVWQTFGTFATSGQTSFSVDLPGSAVSSQVIRFQLKLTPSPYTGTDDNKTPRVAAVEVDYLVVPDTKYGWSFRVLGSANFSRPDGQPYGITVPQLQIALDSVQRNSAKRWVNFTDEDGTVYKVQVVDIRIFKPVIDWTNPDGQFATWSMNLAEV